MSHTRDLVHQVINHEDNRKQHFKALVDHVMENYPQPPRFDIEDAKCRDLLKTMSQVKKVNAFDDIVKLPNCLRAIGIFRYVFIACDCQDIDLDDFGQITRIWGDYIVPPETMTRQEILMAIADDDNSEFADVSAFDIDAYSNLQLIALCRGLGTNQDYGDVSDLSPSVYDTAQMKLMSIVRRRGDRCNIIDDLDPSQYTADEMTDIYYERVRDASTNK